MARPSKFDPSICPQVVKLCRLGATDEEIADFFGVCVATVSNWKNEHPEFLEALKEGKYASDAHVADSLYRRATGYDHEDIYFSSFQGKVTSTPYIKHYPPDPTSMIFWLKNRQKENWRDKREISGDPNAPLTVEIKELSALFDANRPTEDPE